MKKQTFRYGFRFILTIIIASSVNAVQLIKPNGDLNSDGVEQHILHLEQTVADLQAQFQAQEHKQAAVLSSVLSKLASTTDELAHVNTKLKVLEDLHNTTVLELAGVYHQLKGMRNEGDALKGDYAMIKANLTSTVTEVLHQKNVLASTKMDVEALEVRVNTTETVQDILKVEANKVQGNLSTITKDVKENSQTLQIVSTKISQAKDKVKTVAFSSALTSFEHVQNNQVVKYDNVLINKGNGYNSTTGMFTTPYSGTFIFIIYGVMNDKGRMFLGITHNDKSVVSVFGRTGGPSLGASNTAIVEMNRGDKVWVRSLGNSTLKDTAGYARNMFSGYLLAPTAD